MNTLLEDGLGLMVLGMGFVFLFLVVLIVATNAMSSLLNKYFPEVKAVNLPSGATTAASPVVDEQLTAVITAAINQHRAQKR